MPDMTDPNHPARKPGPDAEWFAEWFDSQYYPVLYRHRDEQEAQAFIRQLLAFLDPMPDQRALDLGCGNGRHAIQLAQAGLSVTGVDLSPQQIARAQARLSPLDTNPRFTVGDMRALQFWPTFHYVFNLFTSFGYFDDEGDNIRVLAGVHRALRPGGMLILDYLNASAIGVGLRTDEVRCIDDLTFDIRRELTDRWVRKFITVHRPDAPDAPLRYREQVQLLFLSDFERLLRITRFELCHIWGGYQGQPYDPQSSERLIFFAQKPS